MGGALSCTEREDGDEGPPKAACGPQFLDSLCLDRSSRHTTEAAPYRGADLGRFDATTALAPGGGRWSMEPAFPKPRGQTPRTTPGATPRATPMTTPMTTPLGSPRGGRPRDPYRYSSPAQRARAQAQREEVDPEPPRTPRKDGLAADLAAIRAKEQWYIAQEMQRAMEKVAAEEADQTDQTDEFEETGASRKVDHQHIQERLQKAMMGRSVQELADAIVQAEVNSFGANKEKRLLLSQSKQALRVLQARRFAKQDRHAVEAAVERDTGEVPLTPRSRSRAGM